MILSIRVHWQVVLNKQPWKSNDGERNAPKCKVKHQIYHFGIKEQTKTQAKQALIIKIILGNYTIKGLRYIVFRLRFLGLP